MRTAYILFLLMIMAINPAVSQENGEDVNQIRKIFDFALTQSSCYDHLYDLCTNIGGRLSGSPEAEQAVQWAKNTLLKMGVDTVYLQDVMVPHWVRGRKEQASYTLSDGQEYPANICALGGSVATPDGGITAEVIEVHHLEDIEKLGREQLENKIVFFNRPMEPKHINTFHAYGGCVDQRAVGASKAAPFGALAVIVRSMNLRQDTLPHTGAMCYKDGVGKIPAAAISTRDANMLSKSLKEDPSLTFTMNMHCKTYPDTPSHNVIAEIRGSKYPDEIIVVAGHLDSWDNGQGAHDDGAGCVQSMEVLNTFRKLGIRPERTIRCVLYMNEENGIRGALKYAEVAKEKEEIHLAAIESDRGGFTPRGFTVDGEEGVREDALSSLKSWESLLEPYNLHAFKFGYSGVDIGRLKDQGVALFGFLPDPQRYFDYHHAPNDNIEAVNKRELELGAASMASLVYLISKYGIATKSIEAAETIEQPGD